MSHHHRVLWIIVVNDSSLLRYLYIVIALTYFLSVAKSGGDGRGQTFIGAYLKKDPDCSRMLSTLSVEKKDRNQDQVKLLHSFSIIMYGLLLALLQN